MPTASELDRHFPRYTDFEPKVPIWCVTPGEGRYLHRFFDTSPVSPSGRYLAVTRLPQEQRTPKPGDVAEIVVVDLREGTERVVAQTQGWEPQLGAQVNWGGSDDALLFSDCDTSDWTPHAVLLNPHTGESRRIDGPLYHASPDGRLICGTNPKAMRRTQGGYGVALPNDAVPLNEGAPADDGLFITDVEANTRTLAVSLADAADKFAEPLGLTDPEKFRVYGFHSKFSPTGERVLFTMRWYSATHGADAFGVHDMRGQTRYAVLTCKPDGTDLQLGVGPDEWDKDGHHINWHPDGNALSLNLRIEQELMTLCRVDLDGSNLRAISELDNGSGHPTVHPDDRHVLTDVYAHESRAFGDGTTPLRWIDTHTNEETCIARIPSKTPQGGILRVDPHPAWDRTWTWVAFNAFPGTRRVYLADFSSLL
ncbi:MAG: hypothetical protein AAGD32_10530 [Planctomycetota bacterium]